MNGTDESLRVALAPGYRTTEFWLTVSMHFLTLLIASGVLAPDSPWAKVATLLLSALSQYSYNQSRAQVKAAGAVSAGPAGASPPASAAPQNWKMQSLLLALLLPALLLLGGCNGANAFKAPSASYLAADRATYDTIAPRYSAYTAADPLLDAQTVARRLRTVATWRVRLEQAEKRVPASTQPSTDTETPITEPQTRIPPLTPREGKTRAALRSRLDPPRRAA